MYFRRALLCKIQQEFDLNITKYVQAKESKLQPIREKIKNCKDSNKLLELGALLEDEERKIRRRSSGNVRFIGELFRKGMIQRNTISSCINELLTQPDNEDMLECLCKLMCTVGDQLEDSKNSLSLDEIISQMKKIAEKTDNSKISSRVRFMLKDVIDLRNNKWQSTRNETPKPLEQIEKEVKDEQFNAQIQNYVALQGNGSSGGNKRGSEDRSNHYNDNRSGYNSGQNHRNNDLNMSKRNQHGLSNNAVSHGGVGGNGSGGSLSTNSNSDGIWHVQTSKGARLQTLDHTKLEHIVNKKKNKFR